MNLIFRILLTIYAFFLTLLSVLAMVIIINHEFLIMFYNYMNENVLSNTGASIAMFITALAFFGLSCMFLISGIKSNKSKNSIGKQTNIGEIRISLVTLENIALAASKKLSGVKESKAYVSRYEDGVYVVIKTVVMLELNIPSLSEEIQHKVKSAIEESAGIKVVGVKVSVDNVHTGYKSRVE